MTLAATGFDLRLAADEAPQLKRRNDVGNGTDWRIEVSTGRLCTTGAGRDPANRMGLRPSSEAGLRGPTDDYR
ncbi:hypothetical protein FB566_0835 [Stackebrandtia endophytica]|uniref:Uncharacterized protein n=1 Tax=Stackebrandtia endophytica TaxID=1496996 RepID=A0A543ARY6_9ACTN|nr:hypothetical protein [Stackebrandtia endophytica]TQL75338.1 hypothetical protein FB566_0835 [Stackebrandtia endophytica]